MHAHKASKQTDPFLCPGHPGYQFAVIFELATGNDVMMDFKSVSME